jgi:hypothetical protein
MVTRGPPNGFVSQKYFDDSMMGCAVREIDSIRLKLTLPILGVVFLLSGCSAPDAGNTVRKA